MAEQVGRERGVMTCSCGARWDDLTLAEAQQIGRRHDDSPMRQHVVSSLLFTTMRRVTPPAGGEG